MSKMIEVKVAELSGNALAWAVWLADRGEPGEINPDTGCIWTGSDHWAPQSDWEHGGPLIDKYRMHFLKAADGYAAYYLPDTVRPAFYRNGDTHLIAACRAIVSARLGPTIAIPSDLLEQPT